jgi:hypothetical protein
MVPEPLGGRVVDAFSELREEDPDQCPRMEPRLEGFEAGDLLNHRCGDSGGWLFGDDLDSIQEQAEQALGLEAAPELPDSFRVSVRFVGAVLGRTVFNEDHGPDEFIAPLDLIDKVPLQLRKVLCRFPGGSLHASVSCPPLGSQEGRGPASPYAGTLLLTRAHGPGLQGRGRRW